MFNITLNIICYALIGICYVYMVVKSPVQLMELGWIFVNTYSSILVNTYSLVILQLIFNDSTIGRAVRSEISFIILHFNLLQIFRYILYAAGWKHNLTYIFLIRNNTRKIRSNHVEVIEAVQTSIIFLAAYFIYIQHNIRKYIMWLCIYFDSNDIK